MIRASYPYVANRATARLFCIYTSSISHFVALSCVIATEFQVMGGCGYR